MWGNPIWPIEWSCRSLAWLSLVLDGLPPCFYEDHRHRKGYFGKLFWASSSGCSYLHCSTVSNCWQNNGAVLDLCAQRAKSTNGFVGSTWKLFWNGFFGFPIARVQTSDVVDNWTEKPTVAAHLKPDLLLSNKSTLCRKNCQSSSAMSPSFC